jgi:repressor LexA
MMPEALTDLERCVLDYLVEFLRRNTYQPSVREIGHEFRIRSTKTVSELLESLARKGWIERDPARSRGVRILGIDMNPSTVTVPCYDGAASEAAPETFELDRRLAGAAGAYLLTVDAAWPEIEGVRHGDLLLVEPLAAGATLEPGDIAVSTDDGAPRFIIWDESRPPADTAVTGRVLSVVRRLRPPRPAESRSSVHGD